MAKNKKKNKNIQKAERESLNIKDKLFDALKASMPEAFSESKVNWDKLRRALGEHLDTAADKFNFAWAGKAQAITNVLIPSKATLRPDKKESVKFDESENLFIEGDNLEVLKLLQKSYFEQVKMIYIDPPYNTGNDFVYKDDFKSPLKNYLEQSGQVDAEGNHLSTNTQASGRFHSDWLSMMYPRLKLAWNLLRHDGVIFVSIDDNEVHHLRMIMDEVFGEENFVGQFPWRKRTAKSDVPFGVSQDYEWVLCFAKSNFFIACIKGNERKYYESPDLPNRSWRIHDMTTQRTATERPNSNFTMVNPKTGEKYPVNPNAVWRVTTETFKQFYSENRIVFPGDYDFLNISKPVLRYFKEDDEAKTGEMFGFAPVSTNLPKEVGMTQDGTKDIGNLFKKKLFVFPKPVSLLKYFLRIATSIDKSAIILDFFAGSGTTAHAVLAQNQEDSGNRKFIMVQMPEPIDLKSEAHKTGYKTIADIAKERIRRVIKGYGEHKPINDGFKVFKLDKSNYTDNLFEYDPEKTDEENEKAFKDYLNKAQKELFPAKINEIDIVYENVIKEGLSLNAKIEEIKISKNKVYKVVDTDRELFICLDEKLSDSVIDALTAKEYKEKIFVCFDGALSDSDKANLSLNLTLKTI